MSEFNSILSGSQCRDWNSRQPDFFQDLQLDYLLKIIERQSSGYDIRPYFYTLPANLEEVQFRQQVYRDFHCRDVAEAFRHFCVLMQKSRRSHDLGRQCQEELHRCSYHLEGAACYREALSGLAAELSKCSLHSTGLKDFEQYLLSYIQTAECLAFFDSVEKATQKLEQIRFHLQINDECLTIVESGETAVEKNYEDELRTLLHLNPSENTEKLTGVFPNALEPSLLETTLVQILEKKTPDIFSVIRNFAKEYPSYHEEKILRLEREVSFYLSSLEFERQTAKKGYSFTTPKIKETPEFTAYGVYDIALLWKNSMKNTPVIDNDFTYHRIPSFFVVTGPNQGGKTTFARAAGRPYICL